MGYIYKWTIDAVKVDPYSLNPNYSIDIDNHLITLKVGDSKPDFKRAVKGITYMGERFSDGRLVIDDRRLNLSRPGVYDIWFYLYVTEDTVDKNGKKVRKNTRVTRERMIVICEDGNK